MNGKQTEYTYDGQGNRINVKVTETNPANQTIIADTDFLIDPMTTYNEIVAAIDNQESKTSLYTYGKGRVSVEVAGEVSYYVNNEQGSVTDILDVNGNVKVTLKYDEFGILENPEDVYTSGNIFAYTGHVYDESTGLYYAKARYYEAENSRWISEDHYWGNSVIPISLNLYLYCNNNSINFIDLSGYIPTVLEAAEMADHIYDATKTQEEVLSGGWILIDIITGGTEMKMGVYSRTKEDGTIE